MGIKERRQREIEGVKQEVLQATRRLARENGWPEVSIRKIAEAIEYTPPVIYEHFKNKEAILITLDELGFKLLREHLDAARDTVRDPAQQLLAVSEAFWDWAFAHTELYQVMFNMEGVQSSPTNSKALLQGADAALQALRQLHLFSTGVEGVFFNWWAIVHGHVGLVMSGRIPGMREQIRQYMLDGVGRLIRTL
ncbi:MAG: hypothetical protein OHK0039_38970 [Bacteroidia bacterium]